MLTSGLSLQNCGDVLTKKKLDSHRGQCRGATFTCLDCHTYFRGTEYKSHTVSCCSAMNVMVNREVRTRLRTLVHRLTKLHRYSTTPLIVLNLTSRAFRRHKNIKETFTRRNHRNSPESPFKSTSPPHSFHAKHMLRMPQRPIRAIPSQLLMPLHQHPALLQEEFPGLLRP